MFHGLVTTILSVLLGFSPSVTARPGFSDELRLLLPDIFGGSSLNLSLPALAGGEPLLAIPDPNFSPIVVLLGQDENNQSAVVVLGDENQDVNDDSDDVSAVIGQIITSLSPSISSENVKKVESDNIFTQLLESSNDGPVLLGDLPQILKTSNLTNVEELDKSSGNPGRKIDFDGLTSLSNNVQEAELDQNISLNNIVVGDTEQKGLSNDDYSYFDPDFENSLSSSSDEQIEIEPITLRTDADDGVTKSNPSLDVISILDEKENVLKSQQNVTERKNYTNSNNFRPKFNPPRGFHAEEGRRSRRAKSLRSITAQTAPSCPAAMGCVKLDDCGSDGYIKTNDRVGSRSFKTGGRGMLIKCSVNENKKFLSGYCCRRR